MKHGFTLLELLIVIAILAILATVVILVMNPAEALKKTRDTQRIQDLDNLKSTLLLYLAEKGELDLPGGKCTQENPCKSTCCIDSADGTTYLCPCTGSYKSTDNNGHGWIPLNFTSMAGGSPISHLPVDPINNDTYYYSFAQGSSFEIDCVFESDYYKTKKDLDKKDGGNNDNLYEVGTELTLLSEREGGETTNEVYGSNWDHHIYQFKWSGSSWAKTDLGSGGGGMYDLVVGDGDNDGENEIYGANSDFHIYQFKWSGSSWTKTDLGSGESYMYGVAIGDGNNE